MSSRLLSLDEIITMLDKDFIPLEPFITGLRLKKRFGKIEENVKKTEQNLEVKLPIDFVDLISHYDFGDFEILGLWFGSETNYLDHIISLHKHLSNEDLADFANQFICVAMEDYYTLIMDVKNSHIYAFGSETPFNKKIKIANSFSELIQALGTAYLYRTQNNATGFLEIANEIFGSKSLAFWEERIK